VALSSDPARRFLATACGKCGAWCSGGLISPFSAGCHIDWYHSKHALFLLVFQRKSGPLMQLVADNIACVRGGREVFARLNFSLGGGEALLVTGRNGAGKSSLLRVIAGLVRLSGGRLALDGGVDASIGEQAHYLGHQDAVKPALSVLENLSFWVDYLGGGGSATAALKTVGLGPLAQLPAAYLSAGQKRRLSLARLIAVKRPIWLLDEPTSALDAPSQAMLAKVMRAHLRGRGLIVAASHGPIGLPRARQLQLGPA
jgi:heme exporter protein A